MKEIISIESILKDFIATLDDAIGTFNVTEEENKRVNQLLFTYIVNSFDSFVTECCKSSVHLVPKIKEDYFYQSKKPEEKVSIQDVLDMERDGVDDWMSNIANSRLNSILTNERHAKKLKLLLENFNISKKRFICLSGGGKEFSSGCLKKKRTPKTKRTLNHRTTSEELIGYADITWEKRNSITHNRGKYKQKTIERLNKEWNLEIKGDNPLVKRGTIRSVIRFYTSFTVFFLEECEYLEFDTEEYINLLNTLKSFENIKLTGGIQDKFSIRRKELLEKNKGDSFSIIEYTKTFKISDSTTRRDFKKYQEENNFFQITKGGNGNSLTLLIKND